MGGVCATTSSESNARAELSCRPQLADVGQTVVLTYACRNAKEADGEGFDVSGLQGTAMTTIGSVETGGSSSVDYTLVCTDTNGETVEKTCTVRVNTTSIVMVANPKEVVSGETANIGWVTAGMSECTLGSPSLPTFTEEQKNKKNVTGVTKTPSLTQKTDFVLSCITKAGGTKAATTTVTIK